MMITRHCRGTLMGRPSAAEPKTKFAKWLVAEMKDRDIIKKVLVARSKVGQSSVSQIISGVRNPSREMVERLAAGLAGQDADVGTRQKLIDDGLLAAGYSTGEYRYPSFTPMHSIIREIGLNEKDFSGEEVAAMRSCVEVIIEGYAAKKQREKEIANRE